MNSAKEVSNYLVYLLEGVCGDLTNMKLNKILYYAQGHCLKRTGKPLFKDPIEAWAHGPIVNDVYQTYKKFGRGPVKGYDSSMISAISPENQKLLVDVAREYSRYTAGALRNMTHAINSPWDRTYTKGAYRQEIPVHLIKDYFDSQIPEIRPVELHYTEDDFIGYRDEDGILVLPADWNDGEV